MPIELFHLGEVLVAEILSHLQARGALDKILDAGEGNGNNVSLLDDLRFAGVELPARFLPDSASLAVNFGGNSFSCDGAQTVDVLCVGSNDRAVAVEVKLGETRMAAEEFRRRFCVPCERSQHLDLRLRGSMIAVLEHELPFPGAAEIIAQANGHQWTVSREWWLVVRRRVWRSWHSSGVKPVRNARIIVFEDLANTYGSGGEFDRLVVEIIGSDFASRWAVYE